MPREQEHGYGAHGPAFSPERLIGIVTLVLFVLGAVAWCIHAA